MKTFSGFHSGKVRMVSLPESVFTEIVPLIDDLAELKVTLHIVRKLEQQQGKLRYVQYSRLLQDGELLAALGDASREMLDCALQAAVDRGTLLRVETGSEELTQVVYFANSARGRAAVQTLSRGEWPESLESAEQTNVFTLYHENIGVLTPLLSDELREAEDIYPVEWIEDAFRIAVSLNKRNWRYVRAILERWSAEGRGDETDQRDHEAERRRYIEGEYGDYIQH